MATFRVTGPDGGTYEVNAPEHATDADVFNMVQGYVGTAKPEPMGKLESLGRGITEGATFGFDDKLGMSRDAREKSKSDNPWTHFAGELIGGIAPALATGGASAAVAGGRTIGAKVAQTALRPFVAAPTATLGQAVAQGAKVGGSYGALSGAGHSNDGDWTDLATGAAKGFAVGGAIGAGIGPIGYKIGEKAAIARAANNEMANADTASLSAIDRALARDRIDPTTLRQQIEVPQYGKLTSEQISDIAARVGQGEVLQDVAASVGVSPAAARKALTAFNEQNATPLSIVDRARLTGPAGGENTSWTLRAGMASPGEGRAVAAETLTQRQMDQPGRLVDAADKIVASGNPEARQAAMAQAEKQAYGNAYASEQPFDLSPTLQNFAQRYEGRGTGIATNMQKAVENFSETMPGRPPTYQPFKKLEHFQEAKADLDQQIAQSFVDGRATPLTKRLMELKTQLMDEVSTTNPAWRSANDMFAENAAARRLFGDAQTEGFRLTGDSRKELANMARLNQTVASRKATPEAKAAAQAQIEMYRDGLAEAIRNTVMNKSETGDHVAKLLTPAARHIMTTTLGKKDAEALIKVLRQEQAITSSYRGLGGSQTTPLREAIDELNGPALISGAMDMLNPRALLSALVAKGSAKLSEARNNRMVPMMVESDPIKQLSILRDVETMRGARQSGGTTGVGPAGAVSNAMQDQGRPQRRPLEGTVRPNAPKPGLERRAEAISLRFAELDDAGMSSLLQRVQARLQAEGSA